jgi:hypothetical protein
MNFEQEWEAVFPPRETLMTADQWCGDSLLLSKPQLDAFGAYAGNMWRVQTGWVAGVPDDGRELRFAVAAGVYLCIFEAFAVARGAGTPEEKEEALRAGLDEVIQEGVSEQWSIAVRGTLETWEPLPAAIQRHVSHVLCRFTTAPVQKRRTVQKPYGRMAVELREVHHVMRPSASALGSPPPAKHW